MKFLAILWYMMFGGPSAMEVEAQRWTNVDPKQEVSQQTVGNGGSSTDPRIQTGLEGINVNVRTLIILEDTHFRRN